MLRKKLHCQGLDVYLVIFRTWPCSRNTASEQISFSGVLRVVRCRCLRFLVSGVEDFHNFARFYLHFVFS